MGGHDHGDILWNPADPGIVATVGFARERHSVGDVWNGNGDFLRGPIANGLLGLLRLKRSSSPDTACVAARCKTVSKPRYGRSIIMKNWWNSVLVAVAIVVIPLGTASLPAQQENDRE